MWEAPDVDRDGDILTADDVIVRTDEVVPTDVVLRMTLPLNAFTSLAERELAMTKSAAVSVGQTEVLLLQAVQFMLPFTP